MDYIPKRVAPPILAYLGALMYIAVAVLSIISFVMFIKRNTVLALIFFGVVIVIAIIMIFLSNFFAWSCLVSLMPYNNKLKYIVHDIISVSGNNETVYTIREITKIKKSGKNYILKGSFFVKEPLIAEKHRDRMVIQYYSDEMIERLKEFKDDNMHSRED